jgi:hypothetical protein
MFGVVKSNNPLAPETWVDARRILLETIQHSYVYIRFSLEPIVGYGMEYCCGMPSLPVVEGFDNKFFCGFSHLIIALFANKKQELQAESAVTDINRCSSL